MPVADNCKNKNIGTRLLEHVLAAVGFIVNLMYQKKSGQNQQSYKGSNRSRMERWNGAGETIIGSTDILNFSWARVP